MKHNLGLMVVWLEPASTLPFELRAQAVSYDHEDGHVESVLALRCCIKSTSTGKMYMGGVSNFMQDSDRCVWLLPSLLPTPCYPFDRPSLVRKTFEAFVPSICGRGVPT